jgi:hypothetical protein
MIGVGFLIYFWQGKTDKEVKDAVNRIDGAVQRIDDISKKQHNMIEEGMSKGYYP